MARTFVGAAGGSGPNYGGSLTFSGFTLSAGLYCVITAIRNYPSTLGVSGITVGGQAGASLVATGADSGSDRTTMQLWWVRLTGTPTGDIVVATDAPVGDTRRLGVSVYRLDGTTTDAPVSSNSTSGAYGATLSAPVTLSKPGCVIAGAYGSGSSGGDYILTASSDVSAGTVTPQVAIDAGGHGTWSGGVTSDTSTILNGSYQNYTGFVDAAWEYVGAATYSLAANAGAYTCTGVALGLTKTSTLTADAGAFTLTGVAVGLTRSVSYTLTASAGALTVTGQSVGLARGLALAAATGTFNLTGTDISLVRPGGATPFLAASGGYTISGGSTVLYGVRTPMHAVVGVSGDIVARAQLETP